MPTPPSDSRGCPPRSLASTGRYFARLAWREIVLRKDWLRAIRRSPATCRIAWSARIEGTAGSFEPGVTVAPGAVLRFRDRGGQGLALRLGQDSAIREGAYLDTLGGFIDIGRNCTVNPYCVLYGTGGLVIGDHVRIAAHTRIVATMHRFERLDVPIAAQGHHATGITIEDDVWIGTGATILDGVSIGSGSIVAAGAVITCNVPPKVIVGGVPARLIRHREPGGIPEAGAADETYDG